MSGAGRLGATPREDGSCRFEVWAPHAERVVVDLSAPRPRREPLARAARGYHTGILPDVPVGARYRFVLDDREPLPDPASRSQPDGVHGASEVVDLADYGWTDAAWRGIELADCVLYELHVGTFTADGTFDAVIGHLPRLARLGITAIEIMPVAQFPGMRNWGYDGVLPFAVQHSYGGPAALQRLVDACHRTGLAAILDVVYNHFGPEGDVAPAFAPYFTDAYATPWGSALNFDHRDSDEVRRFFLENALQWIEDFHFDGLRLDAVHAIHDRSALPFLEELAAAVHAAGDRLGRSVLVIGESDENDPRHVRPRAEGGLGMDAVWSDDLHHALHVALTGERFGYYEDFGPLDLLANAWATGMAYTGQYSPHRRRRHGRPPAGTPQERFVVCAQNHDQIGNRMLGERLAALVSPDALRLAAAVVLTSPCTPLLFMGEEHAERRPFLYFTSHGDPELAAAVRAGRKREFAAFDWQQEPPDPQTEETFRRCVLDHAVTDRDHLRWTEELLALRRTLPRAEARAAVLDGDVVVAERRGAGETLCFAFRCADGTRDVELPLPAGTWLRVLDSHGAASAVPEHLDAPDTRRVPLGAFHAVGFRRAP